MEASPANITPEKCWSEEKERALVAFFSENSCLWNHKSESYKNQQLRWKTLEHLRILLSAHPPPVNFTVEDIENKFKDLCTTFQHQYNMVKESQECQSGDMLVPQWKHYQQLMFLQSCGDQEENTDDLPPSSPATSQGASQSILRSSGPVSFPPGLFASSVPSTMMVKNYWTEERERALIAFYSEHSCLWNRRSENHHNRQLKQQLLETLRNQLSDHSVSFSVDDIKYKFKNLRTVFNREYKAVHASKASERPYVSKWKHYQQLLFLCENCDEDENSEELQVLTTQDDKVLESEKQKTFGILNSSSSRCTQTNGFNNISSPAEDLKPDTSTAYQSLLSVSPDEQASQMSVPALPAFLSTSQPASEPNQSPLNFTMSGLAQPNIRLRVEPCCHWSEAKVQQLISFYSEHSCLWNHRLESYRNRQLRQSLLEKLSTLLSENLPVPFTVEDIKTKFRNLRTIFQREHKAVRSITLCGSEDFYLPKWKHYRELMFLCDSCDEEEQQDNRHLRHRQTPSSSLHHHDTRKTSTQLGITSQGLEAPPSPTPPDSRHSSPSTSPRPESRVLGCKRGSHHLQPSSSEVVDFMRTLCESQTTSPHAGFLKYVEECLNETPPDKVKRLKKKIIEMIHSVSEEFDLCHLGENIYSHQKTFEVEELKKLTIL